MKNNSTDYLYYREFYSNQYYCKKGYIEIKLKNGNVRYMYFDKDKHIKLTDNVRYASKFYRIPKNYKSYVSYIQKNYNGAIVNYIETVVVKNKR